MLINVSFVSELNDTKYIQSA